jgi:hypothetical protein
MTGDFTSVPLRPDGTQWIGARMQQGRVLLDGDWNLNVDADQRERQSLTVATIGEAGVLEGSTGFEVTFAADGTLQVGAGEMWVGGLHAVNPTQLAYAAQEAIAALPGGGTALVYLDAAVQEVQPAEDPSDLLDPALDGVDTVTRTRVAWRVHAVPTQSTTCGAAASGLPPTIGTGLLEVARTTPAMPTDPCAPPDDPRGMLPEGLLRVEVLDSGTEATARFAWSYENGSAAVAAKVAGTQVTLAPSPSTTFLPNDLVEVSRLVRRLDRLNNGPLFTATTVTPGAGGSVVTLSSASSVTGNPSGLCLRRWDGQVVGAAAGVAATLTGKDVGVAFTAHPGNYLAGDWWAVRVRGSAADAVEKLTAAPPDGVMHAVASLAVVDLAKKAVLSDCRPTFVPLTDVRPGTCTVTAFPGDDLQAAADRLPVTGGELCLAAGTFGLDNPVVIKGKQRIVVTGVGPATVLRVSGHESVFQFIDCQDVAVENLRAEGGTGPNTVKGRFGEQHLLGALSFLGCTDVTVRECEIFCPDNAGSTQSAVYCAPTPDRLNGQNRIVENKIEVGDQQIGVLVVGADEVDVSDNEIRLSNLRDPARPVPAPLPVVVKELARFLGSHVEAVATPGKPIDSAPGKTPAKTAAPAKTTAGRILQLQNGVSFQIAGPSQMQNIADQFSVHTSAKALARLIPRQGMEKFIRRAMLAPESLALSHTNTRFFASLRTNNRTMAQGIVVGGVRAGIVNVRRNLVEAVIEGIHVGLSSTNGGKENAGVVTISDNMIRCRIPFFWNRSRHAIYVGSFLSLTLHDNTAVLERNGAQSTDVAQFTPTNVEAVRIYGRLGPWLSVRGLSLVGPFNCGVRVTDTQRLNERQAQLKYFSDILNSSSHGPALLPSPFPYAHDRCVP